MQRQNANRQDTDRAIIMTTTRIQLAVAAAVLAISASTAWADDRMKVVTTFTVLADMAQNVAGDAADVVSITKPGAEIHGYEPTPRDIVRAQGADLILWNGLNLERWFEQFLRNMRDVPSVTLSEGIEPISITSGSYEGKANPHAWMGLDNALVYIENIAAAFREHDPDNAEVYERNAAAYKEELRATLEPLREQIAQVPEDQRWLVTCEGAFSYLARDFDMKELYLWPINADQMGTPQQVRAVIDGVRKNRIPVVFCESTVNSSPARQIARETGAHFGGDLYVDSLSEPDGPVPTYLDLLRVTSSTIADGLVEGLAEQADN
ncbi:manganese/iron transport system substrate-binding protein [Paracoccus seriniphilus]|uniref:Manganese/iron transport system substrate-binding protein n=2 Tax=Paracoccus seriniphilus TaxID=184748 RepID=A0A239Q3B2_9RHOB|nr:manganese/iron transport system substrate-binding protein [Paracoccus seriniphilus]